MTPKHAIYLQRLIDFSKCDGFSSLPLDQCWFLTTNHTYILFMQTSLCVYKKRYNIPWWLWEENLVSTRFTTYIHTFIHFVHRPVCYGNIRGDGGATTRHLAAKFGSTDSAAGRARGQPHHHHPAPDTAGRRVEGRDRPVAAPVRRANGQTADTHGMQKV